MAHPPKTTVEAPVVRRSNVRGRTEEGDPNPVDRYVGERVRLKRTLLGMSQEHLADELGITCQQIQKYERGFNRIGASRLFDLAQVLDVPPSFFFDQIPREVAAQSPAALATGAPLRPFAVAASALSEPGAAPYESDPMVQRENLEIMRAYNKIRDENLRRKVFDLVKALAAAAEAEAAAAGEAGDIETGG